MYLYAALGSTSWFHIIEMGAAGTALMANEAGSVDEKFTVGVWNLCS
jgi:hypothetical protein